MTLPVYEPIVKTYLHHAYPLSIFKDDDPRLKKWIYCNYLQLYYNALDERDPKLNFYLPYGVVYEYGDHPLIKTKTFSKKLVQVDIIDFIKNCLNYGYYIVTFIDEFYLEYSLKHMKIHHIHDISIHGYNEYTSMLQITIYDKKGSYNSIEISFTDFIESYEVTLKVKEKYSFYDKIMLFTPNSSFNYEFDIELFYQLMSDFYNSANTSNRFSMINCRNNFLYGLDTYNILLDQIDSKVDLRAFQILWEHKKVIVKALEYIMEQFDLNLIESHYKYKQIENDSLILRNLLIKFSISGNEGTRTKAKSKMESILISEKLVLSDLLSRNEVFKK